MSFDPVHDSVIRNQRDHVDSTPIKSTPSESEKTPSSISRPTAISSLLSPSVDHIQHHQQEQQHSSTPIATKKTDISNLLSDDNPPTNNALSLKNMINQDDTVTDINDTTINNHNNSTVDDSNVTDNTVSSTIVMTPNSRKRFKKEKNTMILDAINSYGTHSKSHNGKDDKEKHYLNILINSRTRHLKKSDGEPYWRKEIQFEFLINLFLNRQRVFRNPYTNTAKYKFPDYFKINIDEDGTEHESNGEFVNFFELYVLALLTSNKLSKILKDRLSMDANYALNFSIACLLVNIGRLNTTVNFDYEMKSQFRTYHSIPSLQVGNQLDRIKLYYKLEDIQDLKPKDETDETDETVKTEALNNDELPTASSNTTNKNSSSKRSGSGYTVSTVKQLQDTPRLKSILKSINDSDEHQPKTFKQFVQGVQSKDLKLNIVTLIFIFIMYEFEFGKLLFADAESADYLDNNNNTMDHLENEIDNDNFGTKTPKSSGSLFNDIWLRILIHPEAKVERFLWLVYFVQETELDPQRILENPFNNPNSSLTLSDFGSLKGSEIADEIIEDNQTIKDKLRALLPGFKYVKHAKREDEAHGGIETVEGIDVDTEDEVRFGEDMKANRLEYLERCAINNSTATASTGASALTASNGYGEKSAVSESTGRGGKKKKGKAGKNNGFKNELEDSNGSYDDPDYSDIKPSRKHRLESTSNMLASSETASVSSSSAGSSSAAAAASSSLAASGGASSSLGDGLYANEFEAIDKRKRMKRGSISSNSQTSKVIPLTSKSLALLLNNDLKHSNSKIAITKKSKNKILAFFLKEYLMQKTEKYRLKRLSFGHVDYFFKNGNLRLGKDLMLLQHFEYADYNKYNKNYVPNIFSRRSDSKSAINNTNNTSNSFNELTLNEFDDERENLLTKADLPHLNSKFEDFGEFKINVYKTYSKVNNLLFKVLQEQQEIQEQENENEEGDVKPTSNGGGNGPTISHYDDTHSSFLDDIFDQVE